MIITRSDDSFFRSHSFVIIRNKVDNTPYWLNSTNRFIPTTRTSMTDKKTIYLWTGGASGICFAILCCIGIILLCVLLPLSFNYVRYDEYGILYSVLTREGLLNF